VTPWQALIATAAYLRAGLLDGAPPGPMVDVSWERVIEVSSAHYVTPALGHCLADNTDVPAEVQSYLGALFDLNRQRNARLLDGLNRIVAALNRIDIEPVLLKGAAHLVEGLYPSPGARFMGDLDVLIPKQRASDAMAALNAIGFRFDGELQEEIDRPMHHLPMLHEPGTGVGVELHTDVIEPPHDAVLPTTWFAERTRPVSFRDVSVRLADPTAAVAHNIVHSQLQQFGYRDRKTELRELLDLAVLRARHAGAIDWPEIDRLFCRHGFGPVLATYLGFAEALFGQPAVKLTHAARPTALADFRYWIDRPRRARFLRIWRYYMAARRRNPRGILKVFRLKTWPGRLRLIMEALKINMR
jgi:Uncharacterised nucleotidyltransferase